MKPVPILKGHAELVEDQARIAPAYLPPDERGWPAPSSAPGAISWAILRERGDPLSAARGMHNALFLTALIFGVPLLVWFAL